MFRFALLALFLGMDVNPPPAHAETATIPLANAHHTFVIVQGAWNGGWAYRRVESLLRGAGHEVYRPTLTGLGERVHLTSASIDLSTHVTDVVNTILFEDLHDVVLVGHSYGGMVISGVADRIPERISRLVYVDAFVPNDGESVLAAAHGTPLEPFESRMVASAKNGLIAPYWNTANTPPQDVAQPIRTFTEPVQWNNPAAIRLRADYILTVEAEKSESEDDFFLFAERARGRHWPVHILTADHDPEASAPEALAALILRITVN